MKYFLGAAILSAKASFYPATSNSEENSKMVCVEYMTST